VRKTRESHVESTHLFFSKEIIVRLRERHCRTKYEYREMSTLSFCKTRGLKVTQDNVKKCRDVVELTIVHMTILWLAKITTRTKHYSGKWVYK
jgi:hypothetical protein